MQSATPIVACGTIAKFVADKLKRVLTLQLNKANFIIPPGVPNYRAEVHGSMPNDALLLSLYPHLHLRGRSFEYNILEPGGRSMPLLRVPHYDFYYRLAEPIPLKAGTVLQAVATWDNSKNNPHNPDPEAAVYWGGQVWEEMMVGLFDVAVDPAVNRRSFFYVGICVEAATGVYRREYCDSLGYNEVLLQAAVSGFVRPRSSTRHDWRHTPLT
jgi:hypothetical protein